MPRALWTDRLMRFKRAGFNCVEVYTFWNFHEARAGQFDFSGDRDLDAFLKLSQSLGLYAIVRVGPYYCAEWESGGYPVWLRSVPDLEARVHNAAFEQYTTRFWNHLMPIVVANQIHRGGNVILVQLENEHSSGWGTDGLDDPYFQFLQSTALASGMEVPYFFSGLHHGHDPAGDSPWSSVSRSAPWFSTEFWCDWFDRYGETESGAREKDWDTWKIIAYGGNGYNYYMAHGGSNFDYYNDDEDAASYDYGAAVGQTGDLRPEYYHFKRAAWFARSFQQILETSDNASDQYAHAAVNPSVTTTARESDSGTILFLANAGTYSQETRVNFKGIQYPKTGSLVIKPREMVPVVTDYPLLPDVSLKVAPTRILGITQQADTTTLVIYGRPNSAAELYFGVPTNTTILAGAPAFSLNGTNLALQTTYPSDGAANFSFQAGARRVRVLVVNDTLVDATWFVNVGGQNCVVCGPRYVGDATVTHGVLRLITELPWQNAESHSVIAYGPGDTPINLLPATASGLRPGAVALALWKTRTGTAQAEPGFDTNDWLASPSGPQQMGADGDFSCYAWYRTTFNAPSTSAYSIVFGNVADRMIPFVDGTAVPAANVSPTSLTATLTEGTHAIAIFTSHSGRNKLVGYNGAISNQYVKGLSGTAYCLGKIVSGPTALNQWKVKMTNSLAVGGSPPASNAPGWNDYVVGTDAFQQQSGYAWFQTTLPPVSAAGAELVKFESVDDNAWVYLNGVLVASNTGWNIAFAADLTSTWVSGGPNVLSVLVQNNANVGGIYSGVTFAAHASRAVLSDWMLHGGPGNFDSAEGWQALTAKSAFNRPQFFKTTFTAAPFETTGPNAMWHVTTSGLSRGSVWVNGHNPGRYPETIPAPGLYIPECWLRPGPDANTLVIFDEEGRLPGLVKVQPENAASRDVIEFRSDQTVRLNAPPPTGFMR